MNSIRGYAADPFQNRTHQNMAALAANELPPMPEKPKEPTNVVGMDRVTLSPEVKVARTRESLGLNPLGKLKLGDFQEAARSQGDEVDDILSQTLQSLGLEPNPPMTLSLGRNGKLSIGEKFTGKNDLIKTLNQDEDFMTAFRQCSACNEILDMTHSLELPTINLREVMTQETNWDDVMSLAKKQKQIKGDQNTLATLADISHRELPYTHTFAKA